MSGMIKIESEVPFGRILHADLHTHHLHVDDIIRHYEAEIHYLAWETVRKQINPFFQNGTGFEGYVVGCCSDSEEALNMILGINQHILDSVTRQYHFDYSFRSKLMRTLTREEQDLEAIRIWSTYFGAELSKLRAKILRDRTAQTFRMRVYDIVNLLPPIEYHELEDNITQEYAVGSDHHPSFKIAVSWELLKSSQQDAWLVAENIGVFGHPLVRTFLHYHELAA